MSTVIRNSTHTWCEIEPPGPFVLANPSTLFEHQHKSDPPKCLATCLVALYHLSTSAHVTFELRWRLLSEPVGTSWHSELIEANLSEVIDFHDLRLQAGRFCKAANVPNEGTQIECRNSDKIFMKVLLNLEPETQVIITFELDDEQTKFDISENSDGTLDRSMIRQLILDIADLISYNPDSRILEHDFTSRFHHAYTLAETVVDNRFCVHDLVLLSCRTHPNNKAIDSWDGSMTYRELENASSCLAPQIQRLLGEPQQCVLLCLDQSLQALVVWLSILRAGAVCTPVDISAPVSTVRQIISATKARILFTDRERASDYTDDINVVIPESFDQSTGIVMLFNPQPADDAMIIFTSGSTGKPKGVVQTHEAISRSLQHVSRALGINETTRFLQFASYSFDASIFEIFGPLSVGGCVCVPRSVDKVARISDIIFEMRASVATLTPAITNLLCRERFVGEDVSLKTLCIGGASPSSDLCERWADILDLYNIYGTTEGGVWDTLGRISPYNMEPNRIGFPIKNPVYVLNPSNLQHICLPGIAGEICVAGPDISKGYLDLPELSAEKWVFTRHGPHEFYRTGDGGKVLRDGALYYIGRRDRQTKINGQRLELGEVETKLREFLEPGYECAVIVVSSRESARLVAFVSHGTTPRDHVEIVHQGNDDSTQGIISMRKSYPDYICPAECLLLSNLPLTQSGKIDYRKLEDIFRGVQPDHGSPKRRDGPDTSEETSLSAPNFGKKINTCITACLRSIRGSDCAAPESGDNDLYTFGFSSIDAAVIARSLGQTFGIDIPSRILLRKDLTTRHLEQFYARKSTETRAQDHSQLLRNMHRWTEMIDAVSGLTIFLTGATGFLGNRILRQIVLRPSVRKVIVLVRGLDDAEARSKLAEACQYEDWLHQSCASKVEVWKGDLSKERMGLSLSKWTRIFGIDHTSREVDLIIHNGAIVNWLAEYESLQRVNVGSTFEILLAMSQVIKPPRFVFVSGGYMSFNSTEVSRTTLAETLSAMPAYDQTKFVCEIMIDYFNRKMEHSNAVVVKPGFIVGAEGEGLAQKSDALWRLIKSWVRVGSVSARDMQKWIPVAGVDAVASLILLTGLAHPGAHATETIVNVDSGLYLREVHQLLAESGIELQILDHEGWLRGLLEQIGGEGVEHPMFPLKDWLVDNDGCIGSDDVPKVSVFDDFVKPRRAMRSNIKYLQDIGFLS